MHKLKRGAAVTGGSVLLLWLAFSAEVDRLGHLGAVTNLLPRRVAEFITTPDGVLFLLLVGVGAIWWAVRNPHPAPAFEARYDEDNSKITPPTDETYRLRVWNTAVESIEGVRPRVTIVPTAPYLKGVLPVELREQHGAAPVFTLNNNAPLFLDLLETSESLSRTYWLHGETVEPVVGKVCTPSGPVVALFFEPGSHHECEVEIQGNNAVTLQKKFRLTYTLPASCPGRATFDVVEIAAFSQVTPSPRLFIFCYEDEDTDEETGATHPYEAFGFTNVGTDAAFNISLLPFQLCGKSITQARPVPMLAPSERADGYIWGGLRRTLLRMQTLLRERGLRPVVNLKIQFQHGEGTAIVEDYLLNASGGSISIRSLRAGEEVEWTDLRILEQSG